MSSSSSPPTAVPTLLRSYSTHDLGCDTTAESPSRAGLASTDAFQDSIEAATPRTVVAACTPQSALNTPLAKPSLHVLAADPLFEGGGRCVPSMPGGAARSFDFDNSGFADVDARLEALRQEVLVFAREQTFSATGLATAAGDLAAKMAATQGCGVPALDHMALIESQSKFLKQVRSALEANNGAATTAVEREAQAHCINVLRRQLQISAQAQSDLHRDLDRAHAEIASLRASTRPQARVQTQPTAYMVNPSASLWSCLPSVRFS